MSDWEVGTLEQTEYQKKYDCYTLAKSTLEFATVEFKAPKVEDIIVEADKIYKYLNKD